MRCTRCGFANSPDEKGACAQCHEPFALGADPLMRALIPVGRTPLSIVAGYLGLAALIILPAPLALGVSLWALYDLKRKPGMHGKGRAIFGLVTGAFGTLVLLALFVIGLVGSHR